MNKITWIQPYYDLVLNKIPVDAKSILDVGSGYGIFGFIMEKARGAVVSSIEPFEYDTSHYNYTYRMTWQQWYNDTIKKQNKFDVIVSTEMIEHMTHEDAMAFLDTARLRADKVIVATPYEFEEQDAYDDNEFQVHRCKVTVEDFIRHEYKVQLLGTFRFKGMTARVLYHPKWINILRLIGVKPTNIIGESK